MSHHPLTASVLLGLFIAPALAGPREDFKAVVEAVAKSPADAALREKAIALARKLNPAPSVPREAQRRMTRGAAAVEAANTDADFRAAAVEFEAATTAAPWWGDAYYNLAVSQDKAKDHQGALRSLRLAALAMPGSKDVETLTDAVEFRAEKAGKLAARLEGSWVMADESGTITASRERQLEYRGTRSAGGLYTLRVVWNWGKSLKDYSETLTLKPEGESISGEYEWNGRYADGTQTYCGPEKQSVTGRISPDGTLLRLRFRRSFVDMSAQRCVTFDDHQLVLRKVP